jgi:hypothetical protein
MDILFIAPAWVKVLCLLSNFIACIIEGYVVKGALVYIC